MATRKELEDYVIGNILFDPTLFTVMEKYLNEDIYKNKILLKNIKEILSAVKIQEFIKEQKIELVLMNRLTITNELEKIGGIEEIIGLQALDLTPLRGYTALSIAKLLFNFPYKQEFNHRDSSHQHE